MIIETHIPYYPGNLGQAYNRIMAKATDWVLFLDHDILILTKRWYEMCVNLIERVGHSAGWITCNVNRIGCHLQRHDAVKGDNIDDHIKVANELYELHGNNEMMITNPAPLSGFFILTNREAWEAVGGFKDGFTGVDNDYDQKLRQKGYRRLMLPGIYCYHLYTKKGLMK